MSSKRKYPVNGEEWSYSDTLYRGENADGQVFESATLEPVAFMNKIEQRYTDQQIELLQKDDGWNVWTAGDGMPCLDPKTRLDIVCSNGESGNKLELNEACWDHHSSVIAYRLTNNDHYKDGVRVVLQEGDYVAQETSMSEYYDCYGVCDKLSDEVYGSWLSTEKISRISFKEGMRTRKLTVAQVLNAENAKGKEVEGQYDNLVTITTDNNHLIGPALGLPGDYSPLDENDTPEPEWKEGELPSDGTKCEAVWEESPDGGAMGWQIVKFKRGFDSKLWFSHNANEIVIPAHCVTFRPIQSERDKVIESIKSLLVPYIRQYKHNNGDDGFVFGYDMEGVEKVLADLQEAKMIKLITD